MADLRSLYWWHSRPFWNLHQIVLRKYPHLNNESWEDDSSMWLTQKSNLVIEDYVASFASQHSIFDVDGPISIVESDVLKKVEDCGGRKLSQPARSCLEIVNTLTWCSSRNLSAKLHCWWKDAGATQRRICHPSGRWRSGGPNDVGLLQPLFLGRFKGTPTYGYVTITSNWKWIL